VIVAEYDHIPGITMPKVTGKGESMYTQEIAAQDLMKDDLIAFTYDDGEPDLLMIENVEWLKDKVRVFGFALMSNCKAEAFSPFNVLTVVWNA
jgi:hypothetical protein